LWISFVSIVLALSGVEAIANLTGVMKRPVPRTARKAIWIVAIEVALFNILLAACMVWLARPGGPLQDREQYKDDMLAFLSEQYIGHWAEICVRALGGILLLSATNTAVTDMISVQYLMARDGELPAVLQKLNRFGVPWVPVLVAGSVPILVLLITHDLERLAELYAIGVIGAVAINVSLCALHPRLRRMKRKAPMAVLRLILLTIWVTLAFTKLHALWKGASKMPARGLGEGRGKCLHLRQQNSRHCFDGKSLLRLRQPSCVLFSFAGLAAFTDSLNR
jgi:amino acid transporter